MFFDRLAEGTPPGNERAGSTSWLRTWTREAEGRSGRSRVKELKPGQTHRQTMEEPQTAAQLNG